MCILSGNSFLLFFWKLWSLWTKNCRCLRKKEFSGRFSKLYVLIKIVVYLMHTLLFLCVYVSLSSNQIKCLINRIMIRYNYLIKWCPNSCTNSLMRQQNYVKTCKSSSSVKSRNYILYVIVKMFCKMHHKSRKYTFFNKVS